jgi:imidazole glycerol-phosphate synthase subunit HisF
MLTKRIIPCLDIKDGKTVKGINFENIQTVGDAVELGAYYAAAGADELVFLDITATNEKRKTFADLVYQIAAHINIPFCVGGGISSVEDVAVLLNKGADKVSINSAAIKNPNLIDQLAKAFGSQCVVLAIDTNQIAQDWYAYLNGGRVKTEYKTLLWAKEAADRGCGEILLTSMLHDGTKNGFAIELTKALAENLPIPIIASGGAGNEQHFAQVFKEAKADAALAASVFHYKQIEIPNLKNYLKQEGINVRA